MTPTTAPAPCPAISPSDRGHNSTASAVKEKRVIGIVLAGAYQSTDDGIFGSLPRPLLPVAQIPLVGHVLRWLRDGGVARATICANRWSRAVESCIGDGSTLSMQIDYVEDGEPRGPAGCARDAVLQHAADAFVVVEGTVVPDCDLRTIFEAHFSNAPAATAVVHYAARSGLNGDRVATPAGIYIFDGSAFAGVSPFGFQDIKEHLLPALRRQRQRVMAYYSPQFSPRVLNAETYLAVNHWMIERIPIGPAIFAPWGPVSRVGDVAAHPSATVHPTARIIGPAVLGAGVSIGPHAVVVGPASVGSDTVIGAGSLVCRSVLWSGCHVGERAFVDASIVGDGVLVAADTTIEGEVKMSRTKQRSWRWHFVPEAPRRQPVPARSLADLALR